MPCEALSSTSVLLEIWIYLNININATYLNSIWNFMTAYKNARLLCHMNAWYIAEMSK